ncbi:amino acid ABC transporter permease [Fodinicurvata sediminis]|uniref:amino acid ABC transporter permease n=1 Tax=Fodinicurvata sediminis TaxID=1121832 RepID=UPI0003FCE569|nr:amino acid ABC transporter permease [Fodinicurvata sediminis]
MTVPAGVDTDRKGVSAIWNDPQTRGIIYQALALILVVLVGWFLFSNTLQNLEERNISTGFGFLDRSAGFSISESLVDYEASDTYGRAFLVGLLNTFQVALLGIFLATILGTIVGILRLSTNWLVAKLASVYVEVLRNIPVLLQLFVWYGVITVSLPSPRQAFEPMPGVFLSNRGFMIPAPVEDPAYSYMGIAFAVAILLSITLRIWARRRQYLTGAQFPVFPCSVGMLIGLPILGWLIGGAPVVFELPVLQGFNFQGGITLSPEFAALLLGLTTYTSAFIAEIVRGGILGVDYGQTEAAASLGLRRVRILRFIILPQALRLIVPPTTSQYLNLTKNSSLAVAIGYPDLVSVGNTTLNQTGQAIEAVTIFMAVYLSFSLSISVFMNWYNSRIALVER